MRPLFCSYWLAFLLTLLLGCGGSSSAPKSTPDGQPLTPESQAPETTGELSQFTTQAQIDPQKHRKAPTKEPSKESWLTQLLQREPEIYQISLDRDHKAELRVLKQTAPLSDKYGLTLCWISLPVPYTRMVIKDIRRFGTAYDIFEELSDKLDIVVVNGGFYGSDDRYTPVGAGHLSGSNKKQ